MEAILHNLWLILLPPLFGAASVFFLRPFFARRRYVSSIFCSGTIGLSFLISCLAVAQVAKQPQNRWESKLFDWLPLFDGLGEGGRTLSVQAEWGFLLDPLSSLLILIITGIGFLIHIYSIGYMRHEESTPRFFGYMNLFIFFMLLLVLANNYLMLFVGWEGVGLCSYLLIGFHYRRYAANLASMKAFLTNRLGDIGLLFGILLLWATFGTVQYSKIDLSLAKQFPAMLGLMTLLLGFGAAGKSAQFPLFTWLPDAMEGPTPVSALIHAATMVTAGVYLIARSSALYALTPEVSTVIGIVGAFTAILAASIAIVEHDIKRILAYSTVSQLGYMFMALGAGAYWVAVFHLLTHAFFKALLFLGAGSVIHALDGEQDIRNMGGLRTRMPVTFWTMTIAALAISGFPGLAGFFSKDEILWRIFSSPLGFRSIYVVGLVTSYMTAFYMWRLMTRTFFGPIRTKLVENAHESPASMTTPLGVLAAGTLFIGWLGAPPSWNLVGEIFNLVEHWLAPVFPTDPNAVATHAPISWLLMLVTVALGLLAMWMAWFFYVRNQQPPRPLGFVYRLVEKQWHIDQLYQALLVERLVKRTGAYLARIDDRRVDGLARVTARGTVKAAGVSSWSDHWLIDGAVHLLSVIAEGLSYPIRLLQAGPVSASMLLLVLGLAALIWAVVVRP
jgi:NADH-quinone oxidoreductase subunit L